MKLFQYRMPAGRLGATEYLRDASAEDLKVLVCISEHSGVTDSVTVAREAFLNEARVLSAAFYFEQAGILSPLSEEDTTLGSVDGNVITEYPTAGKPQRSAGEIAKQIRDKGLEDLLTQCAELLKKPALSTTEMQQIVSLMETENVDAEYLVLVLNDMQNLKNPTVRTLTDRVVKYVSQGLTSSAELQEFFLDRNQKMKCEWNVMKICGIRDRNLTAQEKEAFARWSEVYGYGNEILTLAYDFTVRGAGRYSAAYMDKIVTAWHNAGLSTVEACEKYHMQTRPEEIIPEKKRPGRKKADPGISNYDPEEAFQNVLERSYGKSEKE
ncbi:MAG: DnaD domain protein [Clostridia bacterium]|nr:DnaD domain protein [Clostridia bacterium]